MPLVRGRRRGVYSQFSRVHRVCSTACHSSVLSMWSRNKTTKCDQLGRSATRQQHAYKIIIIIIIKKRKARGCIFPNIKSNELKKLTGKEFAGLPERFPTPFLQPLVAWNQLQWHGWGRQGCARLWCAQMLSAPLQPWDSSSLKQCCLLHSSPAEGCCTVCYPHSGRKARMPPVKQLWWDRGMKTHWGTRGCCSSSTYRLTDNQMGKACDQQRTNLGKMTHSAPLCREPAGHGAAYQAELLLQKQ